MIALFYIQIVLAVICWAYMVTYVYTRLKEKYGKDNKQKD
jgi:hypothetical protein